MPQKGSTYLFLLIKSLDRTEKAYFKKFAERHVIGQENNYLKLFDAIDRQAEYDEAKILREEKYIKQLPYLKNYLFDLVMKSLNVYHADASPENRMGNAILRIRTLYKKGLFDLCLKLIARAKEECGKYDFFMEIVTLLSIENRILDETGKRQDNKKKSDALNKQKLHFLECEKNITELSHLQSELLFKDWELQTKRQLPEAKDFASIMKAPLLQDEKLALSLTAKTLFNNIHSLYYRFIGDMEKHCQYASRHKELHREKFLLFNDALKYIISLNNYYLSCFYTRKFEQCEKILDEMKSLPTRTLREEEEVLGRYLLFKSGLFIIQHDYKKGALFLKEHEKMYERIKNVMKVNRHATFISNVFKIHFFNENYKESLKWMNLMISTTYSKPDSETYCHVLINNLMVHYELGNHDLIPYLIKSAHRFFSTHKILKPFEKIWFKLFTELIKTNANKKQFFEQTKQELETLMREPYYSEIDMLFDYHRWLDSKIANEKPKRKS